MKRGSNKAKTRRLHELELRKHRLKVRDQAQEIAGMKRGMQSYEETLDSLCKTHTAFVIACAVKFGTQTSPNKTELTIPRVDVLKLLSQYEVGVTHTPGGETIVGLNRKEA